MIHKPGGKIYLLAIEIGIRLCEWKNKNKNTCAAHVKNVFEENVFEEHVFSGVSKWN